MSNSSGMDLVRGGPKVCVQVPAGRLVDSKGLSTSSESLQCHPVPEGPPGAMRNGLDAPSPAAWCFSGKLKGKIFMGHWHQKVCQ